MIKYSYRWLILDITPYSIRVLYRLTRDVFRIVIFDYFSFIIYSILARLGGCELSSRIVEGMERNLLSIDIYTNPDRIGIYLCFFPQLCSLDRCAYK